jgi:hypothetical protein
MVIGVDIRSESSNSKGVVKAIDSLTPEASRTLFVEVGVTERETVSMASPSPRPR